MVAASEYIRDALQEIGVQAAEQPLSGDETLTAVRYLNRMMNSWQVDLSYTDIDSPSDDVTIPAYAEEAVVLNLAVRLAPQFDVPVSPDLRANAGDAYRNMLTAAMALLEADYSSNLPKGSGNRYPGYTYTTYYTETDDDA